jgi:hypothetical protein
MNLSVAQPLRILIQFKRDWLKESQFSLTTPRILVVVKGDWQKESQSSRTICRIWVLVERD